MLCHSLGHRSSEVDVGPETRPRPPVSGLLPPLFPGRQRRPWLTCDGAVVVIPRDPGQPHTPLGQVGELQVPGPVWPSWQQREQTPRGTPELEPSLCWPQPWTLSHAQVPGGLRSPQQVPSPACPAGLAQGPPAPSGIQGRTKRRPQFCHPQKRIKGCRARRENLDQPIPFLQAVLGCKHLESFFSRHGCF